jgi:hypothetical protein
MKKFFLAILIGSLGGVTVGLATSPPQKLVHAVAAYHEAKAINKVKATSHVIAMDSPVTGPSGCSATAIGPHTLLTASHCERPDDYLTVDGVKNIPIVKVLRDGDDHSIIFLSEKSIRFSDTAKFVNRPLNRGEWVFIWGNPGGSGFQFVGVLRVGRFVAQNIFRERIVDVFDLASEHGDSGSAIFDINGNIVDVLSVGGSLSVPQYKDIEDAAGAIRMRFTQADFEAAAKF